jgi:2-C-methyl-D-erythritol 2,4-cyclodiphosphate synthase
MVGAQTPQAARLEALRSSIEEAHAWGRPITDDAGALAASGTPVLTVPGDPTNRKLTDPSDVDAVRAILARRAAPLGGTALSTPGGAQVRVGIGFDAHRLVAGREMRMAGVTFPDEAAGPEGHSDGDAALHALMDALLGATSLGDLGVLFPPDDPEWAGVDSADMVGRVVARLAAAGWQPSSADLAIAIARPSIAERRQEMVARVANLLGIASALVSITGTTTDGLGIVGEGGMAAWATATVERPG